VVEPAAGDRGYAVEMGYVIAAMLSVSKGKSQGWKGAWERRRGRKGSGGLRCE
jgi:hypothetical protein